ncbi:MAG: flagellar basal body L-ring protein FlgH [Ignavibacteriaceae bacterium]
MTKKIVLMMVFISTCILAQDMRQNSYSSLFSDLKANRIGDAVTIIVVESSQASNNAETSAGKRSDLGLNVSGKLDKTALPDIDMNMGTNNDFNGSGSTKASGMIRTKISATIDSVFQNGNMLLRGKKKISINGEEQTIAIRGIIRTSDIMSDNSVYSYNISEAEIVIEGSGLIDNAQSPGWLTKFFHWLF